MTENAEPITHSLTVRCGIERAFQLFTEGMGSWWPLDEHSRVVNEPGNEGLRSERLEFQPRPGGSLLEHVSDGRVLPWAEVTAWWPPNEVRLAWRPHSLPEPPTELVVSFTALEEGTRVDLVHRGWDLQSEEFRQRMYPIYVTGWPGTLRLFADAADRLA